MQIAPDKGCSAALQTCADRLAALPGILDAVVVADARSVVVRYDADRHALTEMARAIETTVAEVAPMRPRGPVGATSSVPTRLSSSGASPHEIAVLHSIPGRMRIHVPHLRREQDMAAHLENSLRGTRGIHSVEAVAARAFVIVRYDPAVRVPGSIVRTVGRLLRLAAQNPPGHTEVSRAKDLLAADPRSLPPLLLPTVAVGVSAVAGLPAVVTGGALAAAAIPVTARAFDGVRKRHANVDQLDLAALVTVAALGDFLTGSLMTWLIGLGDLIRARTMRKSRRAISELLSPAGQRAWVERNGAIAAVPVEQLVQGDTVVVYPGDQIPVDGVVQQGQALVDQKVLTGESVPVPRQTGDAVFALTTIADGQISVRVEHIGRETRAGQVVALIENAPLSDTRVQNYAAKLGDRLVLPIFALAGATYLVTADLMRMAAVLILDFATGIRVSAPTTILSAMMGAARQGLFIKGGKAMERLAVVDAVVFDKTGTLTQGTPFVTGIHTFDPGLTPDEVLRLAASAEANLKHPAAKAIVDAAGLRGLTIVPTSQMEYALGMGVQTVVLDQTVHVGSQRYMRELGVDASRAVTVATQASLAGHSQVYVAADGRLVGLLTYADPPRPESAEVIRALRERGVKRIVMLTGDNARAAHAVAGELAITDVISDVFPEQKAEVVQSLREEGYTVAVIGDGINDSPAFTRADVGISLQHGADVAKETADVILLDGNLWGLPRAIDLSRGALGVLKQNMNIVMGPTAVGMAASVAGLSSPLISTLINNGTTVLAGVNALRPLMVRARQDVPQFSPLADEEAPA